MINLLIHILIDGFDGFTFPSWLQSENQTIENRTYQHQKLPITKSVTAYFTQYCYLDVKQTYVK